MVNTSFVQPTHSESKQQVGQFDCTSRLDLSQPLLAVPLPCRAQHWEPAAAALFTLIGGDFDPGVGIFAQVSVFS